MSLPNSSSSSSSPFMLSQWTDCLKSNGGKRPRIAPGTPTGLTYSEAVRMSELSGFNYGFLFSENDPFIGIDVDVDPSGEKRNATTEIPAEVLSFLDTHPTHCHYSPSGHGLHLIYKLDPLSAQMMNTHHLKQGACSPLALFKGDWRWARSFLTFTSKLHPLSAPQIGTLSFEQLQVLLGPLVTPDKDEVTPLAPIIDISTGLKLQEHVPSVEELVNTLKDVPPVFNGLVQRAVTYLKHSVPMNGYEYWLFVGQACAHVALSLQQFGVNATATIADAYIAWSSRDPENYPGPKQVEDKFTSLVKSTLEKVRSGQPVITYRALVVLAKRATLSFPVLAGKDRHPDTKSIRNYEYLFEYESLQLCHDTMADSYAFVGPEETVREWFCPRHVSGPRKEGVSQPFFMADLVTGLMPFLQDRFRASLLPADVNTCVRHLILRASSSNAFKDWVESVPWDGEPRLEQVCNSITFSDNTHTELYRSFIRKSLLAMIGVHYWPEDHPKIPAILVLKGPQRTYKSSWAEWLIPPMMSQFLGMADTETIISGATERDRLLSTRAVLVVNECETLFSPKYEQRLKAAVDQEMVTFRDLYASSPVSRRRTALIIGTTNRAELYTGSLGTRKIWQIPVQVCDSYLVLRMDKQQLFAEIKTILEQHKQANPLALVQDLWSLTDTEMRTIEVFNRQERGVQGMDALLVEVFGEPEDAFDESRFVENNKLILRKGSLFTVSDDPNCWKVTTLLAMMKNRFPDDFVDRKSLTYAAARYCAIYTDTLDKPRLLAGKKVVHGVLQNSSNEKLYLFPSVIAE